MYYFIMKKIDNGILICTKKFGNSDILAQFLTPNYGVINGLIKGGQSKKNKSLYQIGSVFNVEWMARLEEQLGVINADLVKQYIPLIMHNINKLELLDVMCNFVALFTFGDENTSDIYNDLFLMINMLSDDNLSIKYLLKHYFLFEKNLLMHLGFALELDKCTVNGCCDVYELKYISPNTGKAVSNAGAVGYEHKLLKMPEFFIIDKNIDLIDKTEFKYADDVLKYFFNKNLFEYTHNKVALIARNRLIDKLLSADLL